MWKTRLAYIGATAVLLAACNNSSDTDPTDTLDASKPETASPATQSNAPAEPHTRTALFGDLHVHTKNSFDAYAFGTRTTPDDAYRFAKGETISHNGGFEISMEEPLDFFAVTDHGEYLGVVPAMNTPRHPLSQTETAKAAFGSNANDAQTTFQTIGLSFVVGNPIEEIYDHETMDRTWADIVDAAERHNDPGNFTTFAAYEFTAMRLLPTEGDQPVGAANLHRNVVFRDKAPTRLFTTLDSTNPEDLWTWMDDQRESGIDVLAIPHNSNASNGGMFASDTYNGEALTEEYAETRLRNEPLVEIAQIKGTSETHPLLSPYDEWADFEQYEYFIGSAMKATVGEGDFVRTALSRGLKMQAESGFNPYRFGVIAASDSHVSAGSDDEEHHWGKFPTDGRPAGRDSVLPPGETDWDNVEAPQGRLLTGSQYSAAGLAGVWADANTRDDIFEAMQRKETFGTSGPRMRVRLFAGNDFANDMLTDPNLIATAYQAGVPMGGELVAGDASPAFLAWAMRDPSSAPLQRLQIVKTWRENGEHKEMVYDAACSGGAVPNSETHRCPDNGASVDTSDCSRIDGTGAAELKTLWRDPNYTAGQNAAYYVRVLENPSCHWSSWDAVRSGGPHNPKLTATLQERAWTSPIWVNSQ